LCESAVWLYHHFCLRFRDVEDFLADRAIIVSYETIGQKRAVLGQAICTLKHA
jgi:transposase-like protein